MLVKTDAIVISSVKYSEADLIVSCFTRSAGVKSYMLRGILKSRKGKLRTSYFQPLTILEIQAIHRDKGTLERITEAKVVHPYASLHSDIVKSALVLFLSEVLREVLTTAQPDNELFNFMEQSLLWLDDHSVVADFHLLFLFRLSAYLGFYPDENSIEELFHARDKTHIALGDVEKEAEINVLSMFFGIDFDGLDQINLTKKKRAALLDLLLMYYQLHIQDFKKPKSLLVLNQIFN